MVAKIITFTGNAVHGKDSWVCHKCGKKFTLDLEIVSKKCNVNNTKHYHVKCAKKLNLL